MRKPCFKEKSLPARLPILCLVAGLRGLFAGLPADDLDGFEARRIARTENYRAVLAAIAADPAHPRAQRPYDLPDGIREAIEAWTKG
jgi:hypothetical protein